MQYNEKEIKEQLNSLSASVDTAQLWNDIRHHAPIKKKKRWLPFLMFFALGGLMSFASFQFFFQRPCSTNEDKWMMVIDSITAENQTLKENLLATTLKMDEFRQDVIHANETIKNNIHQNHNKYNAHILTDNSLQRSPFLSQSKAPQMIKSIDIEPNAAQSEVIDQSLFHPIVVEPVSIINRLPLVSEANQQVTDMPMTPKIRSNHVKSNWQYYLGITSGAALVTDGQYTAEGNQRNTGFTPYVSYTAELGLIKKLKGRFSFGALVNFSNMIYLLNYNNKLIENISLIDTTEIAVLSNGAENVVIGNVGGIKITEQKGKIHGYQHRVSIIPTLYYQSLAKGKFHLYHHIGVGIDVLNYSKNIIPTYDSRSFLSQQVKGMAFKPYLRVGTQVDYLITKDLSAALLMQCTYRNENYNFSSYRGTRSSIFPSIGFGLTFH